MPKTNKPSNRLEEIRKIYFSYYVPTCRNCSKNRVPSGEYCGDQCNFWKKTESLDEIPEELFFEKQFRIHINEEWFESSIRQAVAQRDEGILEEQIHFLTYHRYSTIAEGWATRFNEPITKNDLEMYLEAQRKKHKEVLEK